MVLDPLPHLGVLPSATAAASSPSARCSGSSPARSSAWNALGLAQGHCDRPRLTSRGIRQAHDAASQLRGRPIGAVYASDLQRAVATAAPLAAALGLDFTRDPRLRERGLGVLEGTKSVTVRAALSGVARSRVIHPDSNRSHRTATGSATCTGASPASPMTCAPRPPGAR